MSNQSDEPRGDRPETATDQDEPAPGVELGATDGEGSTFEPEEDPEGASGA